jgi:hypothetical protein
MIYLLLALLFAALLGLAMLTYIGSQRRGDSLAMSILSAAMFPAAWTLWYIKDVLRQPGPH